LQPKMSQSTAPSWASCFLQSTKGRIMCS
jgi:hypothetical protein